MRSCSGALRCLLVVGVLVAGWGCEDHSAPSDRAIGVVRESKYKHHLRQGMEQMRRQLHATAAAEFEKCRAIKPNDPELLFHLARLRLAEGAGASSAVPLLRDAVARDPRMVKAHRLLYILHTSLGQSTEAARHRAAVERLYGEMGVLELDSTDFHLGKRKTEPAYSKVVGSLTEGGDRVRFARAMAGLKRGEHYDPDHAVQAMEALMRKYPDLTALRLVYGQILLRKDIRIQSVDRADLPPASSRLILDFVQSHMERVFDASAPGIAIAWKSIDALARTAMGMGDFDAAIMHLDNLLAQVPSGLLRRHYLSLKGIARHKQNRHAEAVSNLEQAVRGDTPKTPTYLPNLWNLHLAYEAAGTPAKQRALPFRFRSGLPLSGDDAPLRFEDVAAKMGVNKYDGLGPSAWADYDNDGDFDLFTCGCNSYGALYRNDGDRFRDVTAEAGLFHVRSGFSATFQDYDNDGDRDLYIGRDGWNGLTANSLYRNNGDGTFTDVTETAGVGHPGSSFVHLWLDHDRDGFLDLFVANGILGRGDTNVLYHNNGDGTFSDVTSEVGLQESSGVQTIGFAVGDYDKDGWSDIFIGGFNGRHRLYHNRGDGRFEEVAAAAGLNSAPWERIRYVSFFFDYDNDTYPDILMTHLADWHDTLIGLSNYYDAVSDERRELLFRGSPRLYRNNRDGTFTDVSRQAEFLYPCGTMGANVADLDNDGFQDVYFATGDPSLARMEPDRFYRNNGDGTFTDWTFAAGLGNIGKGHGVTFVDVDRDGDLDLYVPEGGFVHSDAFANALYLNLQTTGNSWLHIDLEGDPSNRDAVGTSITVTAGGMTQLRQVKGGRGFGSSDSPTVEFGLAKAAVVDRIEIDWPSGTRQVFEGVPVNRRIFLHEGRSWTSERDEKKEADAENSG